MKRILLIIAMTSLLVSNCKKKDGHDKATDISKEQQALNESAKQNQTKLVKAGPYLVAFDFVAMPLHERMMEIMKVKMKHIEGATHGLMLTIMDDATKALITDAKVKLVVTDANDKSTNYDTEMMSSEGMHHYGVHIKANAKGMYRIIAMFSVKGKSFTAETDF